MRPRRDLRVPNPYEFEPGSPYEDLARQATLTDFINSQGVPASSPRLSHVKNSRSESNTGFLPRKSDPVSSTTARTIGRTIHKSESSPSLLPQQFSARRVVMRDEELLGRYGNYKELERSPYDDHQSPQDQACIRNDRHHSSRSPPRHVNQDYFEKPRSRSPSRFPNQDSCDKYVNQRTMMRSPTKTLDDVSERDEHEEFHLGKHSSPSPPKKRSRSPMKKMFGDHGWLGQSPDEKSEPKRDSKKSSSSREQPIARQKKTSMIGKLKTKIEEFVCF